VLAFTLGVSLLIGLLFGLAPALQSSKPDLQEALKEGGRSSFSRHRLLKLLVVVEIALALLLVIGAGLLTKTFYYLIKTDLGFDTSNLLTVKVSLPGWKYVGRDQQTALYERIFERTKTLPGVKDAGGINLMPMSGNSFEVLFSTSAAASPQELPTTNCAAVMGDYFPAMGIPLVKGRLFTEQDTKNSPKVVLIDEAMARRFWPNGDALNQTLIFQGAPREIVGIVGTVGEIKQSASENQSHTQMYVPQRQFDFPWPYMHFVMRTQTNDPANLSPFLRSAIWMEDKDQPVDSIRSMTQLVGNAVSRERFSMVLLIFFATMSVILAALGIYGVMAYSVTQRMQEIGIRRALGAQNADILKMIVRQGLILVIIGVAIGLIGAFALTRVLSSVLYKVGALDVVIFLEGALLLAGVALLASYLPARKATQVDPIIALRNS
jgi:putative ABC transport system permease protein